MLLSTVKHFECYNSFWPNSSLGNRAAYEAHIVYTAGGKTSSIYRDYTSRAHDYVQIN